MLGRLERLPARTWRPHGGRVSRPVSETRLHTSPSRMPVPLLSRDLAYMDDLLRLIKQRGVPAPAPIEQRWTAASSAALSPAGGPPGSLFSWVGVIMYLPDGADQRREVTQGCAALGRARLPGRRRQRAAALRCAGQWPAAPASHSPVPICCPRSHAALLSLVPSACLPARAPTAQVPPLCAPGGGGAHAQVRRCGALGQDRGGSGWVVVVVAEACTRAAAAAAASAASAPRSADATNAHPAAGSPPHHLTTHSPPRQVPAGEAELAEARRRLAARYPLAEFAAARRRLDPQNVLGGPALDALLAPGDA